MANFSINAPLQFETTSLNVQDNNVDFSLVSDSSVSSGGTQTVVNNSGGSYQLSRTSASFSINPISNLIDYIQRPSTGQIYPR